MSAYFSERLCSTYAGNMVTCAAVKQGYTIYTTVPKHSKANLIDIDYCANEKAKQLLTV